VQPPCAQVHLWKAESPDWKWVPGLPPQLPEPFVIERLVPMMDEAGVDRALCRHHRTDANHGGDKAASRQHGSILPEIRCDGVHSCGRSEETRTDAWSIGDGGQPKFGTGAELTTEDDDATLRRFPVPLPKPKSPEHDQ
jgi:hypothetical protein